MKRLSNHGQIRTLALIAGVLTLTGGSIAVADGEGDPLRGGARNPGNSQTQAYSVETEVIADNATYGTRQSNKRNGDGGGAIYGCRSLPGREPCLRATNLNTGRAFEFETNGKEGGLIALGDPSGAPLTTNATGVATGFNADRVDGKDASDLASAGDIAFAAVAANGTLGAERGATAAVIADEDANTYTVTFERAVGACSYSVTDTSGSADPDVAFAAHAGTADTTVTVDQQDDTGGGTTETAVPFHLQVVC